ncbi:MAG: FAD-dependent thymidylate synthase [Chloroflexota bacterium]
MPDRQIYVLSPKALSAETIAVAFAKTSRAPESFREIAAELSDESSARFHEKWVVGYGHASVAEHAILHLAFENVSRLAVENIESNRLASFTEKSTRYQKWGSQDFFIPPELEQHALRDEYMAACRFLFDTYEQSLQPVRKLIEAHTPMRPNENEASYDRRIRSQYVDSCRFLLPAASLANLGMTANARILENSIRKMLSHPLAEVRQVGQEVKQMALTETPTLVKYANPIPHLESARQAFGSQPAANKKEGDWCQLVDYDRDGETRLLAAIYYRFGDMPYEAALHKVRTSKGVERAQMAEDLLGKLSRYDIPLRELEYTNYTFDLVMDQGAYAEFKRHRMMTQTPQELTTRLGYCVPSQMREAGFENQYRQAMQISISMYEKLVDWNPHVASYIVPNGFNRRVLCTFNLREAYHFCQLRSAANAHYSIRRVALRMAEQIQMVHPLLGKYMHLPEDETWQSVETKHFSDGDNS